MGRVFDHCSRFDMHQQCDACTQLIPSNAQGGGSSGKPGSQSPDSDNRQRRLGDASSKALQAWGAAKAKTWRGKPRNKANHPQTCVSNAQQTHLKPKKEYVKSRSIYWLRQLQQSQQFTPKPPMVAWSAIITEQQPSVPQINQKNETTQTHLWDRPRVYSSWTQFTCTWI